MVRGSSPKPLASTVCERIVFGWMLEGPAIGQRSWVQNDAKKLSNGYKMTQINKQWVQDAILNKPSVPVDDFLDFVWDFWNVLGKLSGYVYVEYSMGVNFFVNIQPLLVLVEPRGCGRTIRFFCSN